MSTDAKPGLAGRRVPRFVPLLDARSLGLWVVVAQSLGLSGGEVDHGGETWAGRVVLEGD